MMRTKEARNKTEAEALEAEEKVKELEARLEASPDANKLVEDALAKAQAQHATDLAQLQAELETERKKLENCQAEYVACKKERNEAQAEALDAEEQLAEYMKKHPKS